MEKLESKIAYLRGLAEGMEVSGSSREGRVIVEIIQLLDDMNSELKELHVRVEETEDYTEAIDEDLEDLELLLYEDDDDLYEMVEDCEEHQARNQSNDQFYDLDDDEEAYMFEAGKETEFDSSYEIECPTCQEVIFLHEGVDGEGYHHYVIEPHAEELEAINPT